MARGKSVDTAMKAVFTTAPQNRSQAAVIAEVGATRARRRKQTEANPLTTGKAAAEPAPRDRPPVRSQTLMARAKEIDLDNLPVMDLPWMKIQERVFALEDPEAEYDELESALKLTEALTPGNLQEALNAAEDNARRAHRLYVVARVQHELFEIEMLPVLEALREAANADLQDEKDRKLRSKAITDADIKGRASVLFPDEWAEIQRRILTAQSSMDHMKEFAARWSSRCYGLSSMLNAGKRS